MKKMKKRSLALPILMLCFASLSFYSCDTADDIRGVTALRNVNFTFDSLSMHIILPENTLPGQSFADMYEQYPEIYGNPANYGIELSSHYLADNTSSNARDAKFDGMIQDLVFSDYDTWPLRLLTPAFEVSKDEIRVVKTEGMLNLETHKLPGKYIFQQTVDGNPVSTSILSELMYKLGTEEGSIALPQLQRDIPTRASDQMKEFLSGLLQSGLLDD